MAVLVVIPCQDELEAASDSLRSKLSEEYGFEVRQIGPLHYAWSSGLSDTVGQEIELAFSSNHRSEDEQRKFIEFIDFEDRLSEKIEYLSGGWRKFLVYSLIIWLHNPNDPLIVFASSQFLDDDLILSIINNLDRRNGVTYLFEFDPSLMDKWSERLEILFFDFGSGAEEDEWMQPYVNRFGQRSILRL